MDFGQIKNKFLKALGVTLLKNQKCLQFFFAFCLFYECNAAWTAKSTKSKSFIYIEMQFWNFSNKTTDINLVGKLPEKNIYHIVVLQLMGQGPKNQNNYGTNLFANFNNKYDLVPYIEIFQQYWCVWLYWKTAGTVFLSSNPWDFILIYVEMLWSEDLRVWHIKNKNTHMYGRFFNHICFVITLAKFRGGLQCSIYPSWQLNTEILLVQYCPLGQVYFPVYNKN